jgi:hypothetical protein
MQCKSINLKVGDIVELYEQWEFDGKLFFWINIKNSNTLSD